MTTAPLDVRAGPPGSESDPMRVLMVSRSLPVHLAGGLESHTLDLARGLARRGVRVDLLSTPAPESFVRELAEDGVALKFVENVPPGRYSLAYFRRVGARIAELQSEHGYDVIHGHEFSFGFANLKSLGAPTVLGVHGTITSETPLHRDVFRRLTARQKAAALARFGRRGLFRAHWLRAMDQANVILVDSDFTAAEVERVRPGAAARTRKVPLAVDPAAWPEPDRAAARAELGWNANPGLPHLITVGRVEWQKGHERALRALALLRDEPWCWVIVGEGSRLAPLRDLAAGLGLGDRVEFWGRVDDRRRALAMAAADLFIWPERTHPAFGLVGLESMLMNTPVAGSRRGAIPEVLGDLGWLFDPEDLVSVRETLAPLLRDPALLASGRSGLREWVADRFPPEAMIDGTLEAYREAIAAFRSGLREGLRAS